jgi:uncharacterized delta-60 repeat protein
MASNAILAAAGLVTSPNQLDRQEGSLSEASNVVIKRDGIIEQRRGFTTYGDAFPSSINRAKQITSYRERIIRHYASRLQFDSNGIGRFLDIEGSVVETEQGLRLKFVESNGNLYFTTRNGVKKLSAKNTEDLALMSVEDSGIEKALDVKATEKIIDNLQTGFLPQDSTVAYRVVWNKEDKNENLITGAPSQRAIVKLPLGELIVRDTMRLLQALDSLENSSPSTARIDDGNYLQLLKLQLTSTPSQIRTNLIALADKLDNDIVLAKRSISDPAPVRIDSVVVDKKVATLTFETKEVLDIATLNALDASEKTSYTIYKTTSDNKIYRWDGSSFIEKDILKDYFSSGLEIKLSGLSLTTRPEIQRIKFGATATTGDLTIRYRNIESGPIAAGASLNDIKSAISKVPGLELIDDVQGNWNGGVNNGFTLTFAVVAGDLDQITVGSSTTLKAANDSFILVTTETPQDGISQTVGDLNDSQIVSSVSENSITFNTPVVGVVTVEPGADIRYHEFRSIPEPLEPSSPANNIQLQSLQVYLDTILEVLQSIPSSIVSEFPEQEYASISDFPLTGEAEIVYKATDTNKTYLWGEAEDIQFSKNAIVTGTTAKFNSLIQAITTQTDGKILIGGFFTFYAGQTGKSRLIRLNKDGTEDFSFSTNAVVSGTTEKFNDEIRSIAVQQDGKILVGGNFTNYAGQTGKSRLIRLNSDGTEDSAFTEIAIRTGTTAKFGSRVNTITLQSDGKILIGGDFTNYAGQTGKSRLIRLNSDGTEDTTFSENAIVTGTTAKFNNTVITTSEQSDGKILVGGNFTNYAGQTGKTRLIRLNSDGTEDTVFTENAVRTGTVGKLNNIVQTITTQIDGKILIGGNFTNYASQTGKSHLIRLNPNGIEDSVFSANAIVSGTTAKFNIAVQTVKQQADGKILIGGTFTNYAGQTGKSRLIRLNLDGTEDFKFSENAIVAGTTAKFLDSVLSIAVQSDSKILIGGTFTNYAGQTGKSRLIRLNSDKLGYNEDNDDKSKLEQVDLTTSANVELTFTIPIKITTNDFYQIYRSSISQAVDGAFLDDLSPNDEMKLVFEAYPTQEEIDSRIITVLDETPEIFRGANLYTNAATGEGTLQTNDQPPFAKDINRYRNSVFYANTRTKHRLELNLLPVESLVQNYDEDNKPQLTITNGEVTNTYTFITGENESFKIIVNTTNVSDKSFKITSSRGLKYRVYFTNEPTLDEGEIALKVQLPLAPTEEQIAVAISSKLSTLLDDFSTSYTEEDPTEVVVTNIVVGEAEDPADVDTEFDFQMITQGRGATLEGLNVLLSTQVSIAQAVDSTAKSLIEIINKNPNESVYAFYLSGVDDVPGKILLESRSLEDIDSFYVSTNIERLGESINPDISPDFLITQIESISDKTTITTDRNHGLLTGDEVVISGSNSTPSIDGIHTITRISDTQFTITELIEASGDKGSGIDKEVALSSTNESKPNRVYYSKFNQPEAVPFINYFDLGASDKKIIRILPLRDSLFVFKEDGLFRISGETAPFQSELFDNSFILLAPDSLDVCNNVIYGWTTQGIQALTESGASVISRNIDNILLKTQSSNYVNFKTATWGVGYESDNSYIIFTVKNMEDETAQIAYRYSTITNTWTTYDKSFSCGHIADFDDHFYAGATDIPNIEKERKTFSRLDYADREYDTILGVGRIQRNKIILPSVLNFEVGDVLVQDQTMTIYEFNQLLKKLDADTGVGFKDYFDKFKMDVGSVPKNQLISLATYLDTDTKVDSTDFETTISSKSGNIELIELGPEAVITSPNHGLLTGRVIQISGSDSIQSINGVHTVTVLDSNTFTIPLSVTRPGTTGSWQTLDGDFNDLKTCYNTVIAKLNADIGVNFSNYRPLDNNTIQEAIIVNIDRIKREITTNLELQLITGSAKVFKAIKSSITYSPNTFGDPLSLKHLREATLMFETRTLTSGILSFATDLLPQFIQIAFNLDGNGIFGHQAFGENFFGGLSNSAPFRTYIPRQCQRCRYIIGKFSHSIAREDWRLLGITMTGEVQQSTRAFR